MQYNQMIFSHVYFFIICLLVELIMQHNTTIDWKRSKVISVDIAIFFIFLFIRAIANTINTWLYFSNYPIEQSNSPNKNSLKETE